jgi:hypothetical protein
MKMARAFFNALNEKVWKDTFGESKPIPTQGKDMSKSLKMPVVTASPAEEKVKIPNITYKNIQGSFGVWAPGQASVNWQGCRDRFHQESDPDAVKSFLFFHQDKVADHVIDFIKTVEEIIKLKDCDRLKISKTDNKNVLFIEMSPWWKYRVRRSLLTALLRCGQNYTERTAKAFDKALYSFYYTASTKYATQRFLEGHTGSAIKKNQQFGGWYQYFFNKQTPDIDKTLVKVRPKTEFDQVASTIKVELDKTLEEDKNRRTEKRNRLKEIVTSFKKKLEDTAKKKGNLGEVTNEMREQLVQLTDIEIVEKLMGTVTENLDKLNKEEKVAEKKEEE